jgi:diguanylate cyclase (GGDEF)-like protein
VILVSAVPLFKNGRLDEVYASFEDITQRVLLARELRHQASTDALTGASNRRSLMERIKIEFERVQRHPELHCSLLAIDLDHFKQINDRHGHAAGDAVLRDLALALKSTFREVDIVARVGGEEFAVLLPSAAIDDALRAANRLLTRLAQRVVEVEGARITYTVSGGLAAMDASVSGLDVLMKRADDALYAAKNGGRNQIVCWGAE